MKIKNKIKYELIMGVIFEKICKIIYINYNILIKKHFIIKFLLFVIISLLSSLFFFILIMDIKDLKIIYLYFLQFLF